MIESTTPKDNTLNKEKNETEETMEPSVNLKRKHKTKSENNKKLSTGINVPVYSTEQENEIMDHIINSLPTDNNRYYTEHKEGSNTFKMKKHPKQDRLYGLISNTEKKYLG